MAGRSRYRRGHRSPTGQDGRRTPGDRLRHRPAPTHLKATVACCNRRKAVCRTPVCARAAFPPVRTQRVGVRQDEWGRDACDNRRMGPPVPRARARQLGLNFGSIPVGECNAVTDVPGVRVGHVTVWHDDPDGAVARTGATVVVPDSAFSMWRNPMAAGTAVLNGAGELTGSIEIREWGVLESPVTLVSTNNIGRGFDAMVDIAMAEGVDDVMAPTVGECDDSWLDDIS